MAENEGLVIGDIVKWEEGQEFSRETLTVLDGQTLAIGEVAQLDANEKVIELAAAVAATDEVQTLTPSVGSSADEVQTLTPSVGANADCVQVVTTGGTQTGGTFKLGIPELGDPNSGVRWTDTIAWSATEATQTASVQTALDDLLGANVIVATEIPDTATMVLTLTWSGTGATNVVQGLVSIDIAALTGASTASVAITTQGGGTITAGTYRLGITDQNGSVQWTAPIAFDGNAAAINTALDDAVASSAVVATGGPMSGPTAVVLTFSGTNYADTPQPMVVVEIDDLAGCDDVSVVETTAGGGAIRIDGTYRIGITDFNGAVQWTYPIAANANAAAINTALDDALGVAGVVATGGALSTPTAIVLTYSGTGYTGIAFVLAKIDVSNTQGVDDISVVETTAGGVAVVAGASAAVILLEAASPSGADGEAVCLVRNAVVDEANLTKANSATTATVLAALRKVNATTGYGRIIVRTGPTYTTL